MYSLTCWITLQIFDIIKFLILVNLMDEKWYLLVEISHTTSEGKNLFMSFFIGQFCFFF